MCLTGGCVEALATQVPYVRVTEFMEFVEEAAGNRNVGEVMVTSHLVHDTAKAQDGNGEPKVESVERRGESGLRVSSPDRSSMEESKIESSIGACMQDGLPPMVMEGLRDMGVQDTAYLNNGASSMDSSIEDEDEDRKGDGDMEPGHVIGRDESFAVEADEATAVIVGGASESGPAANMAGRGLRGEKERTDAQMRDATSAEVLQPCGITGAAVPVEAAVSLTDSVGEPDEEHGKPSGDDDTVEDEDSDGRSSVSEAEYGSKLTAATELPPASSAFEDGGPGSIASNQIKNSSRPKSAVVSIVASNTLSRSMSSDSASARLNGASIGRHRSRKYLRQSVLSNLMTIKSEDSSGLTGENKPFDPTFISQRNNSIPRRRPYSEMVSAIDSEFQCYLDQNISKKYGEAEYNAAVVLQRSWRKFRMAERFGSVLEFSKRKKVEGESRVDKRISQAMKRRSQVVPVSASLYPYKLMAANLQSLDKTATKIGSYLFNLAPDSGIRYLVDKKIISSLTANEVADYLLAEPRLSKQQIGNYLSKKDDFCGDVRLHFMEQLSFKGKTVLDGLRQIMNSFHLTGESSQVQRTLETFAFLYHRDNPGVFKNSDVPLVLAYSMLMLNTDAHDANVKKKMTERQFIRNNRGIDGTQDPDIEMQKMIYRQIQECEIKTPVSNQLERCINVVSRITDCKLYLAPPHRSFIKEVSVMIIDDLLKKGGTIRPRGRRKVFIFNDVLIITKPEKSLSSQMSLRPRSRRHSENFQGKYVMAMMIPLVGCKVYKVKSQAHDSAVLLKYHGETAEETVTLKVVSKGIERDELVAILDERIEFVDKVERVRMEQKRESKSTGIKRMHTMMGCKSDSLNVLSSRRATLDAPPKVQR